MNSNQLHNPGALLDALIQYLHLKNDAALGRALEVQAPIISKIRSRRAPVSAAMLIRMHEVSNLSIRDLRFLMDDYRDHSGRSAAYPREGNLEDMRIRSMELLSSSLKSHAVLAKHLGAQSSIRA